jgi:phenylacetate-CoA ligase
LQLPFVYLYGRADLSTKLYGAIIYPEHVKTGLQKKKFEKLITGRFTMTTEHDKTQNEYLEINIELRPGIKDLGGLEDELVGSIVNSLCYSSGEYLNNHNSMPDRVRPRLVFWPYEHSKYFPPGIKQKWVIPHQS